MWSTIFNLITVDKIDVSHRFCVYDTGRKVSNHTYVYGIGNICNNTLESYIYVYVLHNVLRGVKICT